jgi:allophanate hydrolase
MATIGIIGVKPTLGTISTVGLVPAVKTADCITIIAPTMHTARSTLAVMQYYDPEDIYARDPQQLWLLANQPSWPAGTPDKPIRYGIPPPSLLTTSILSPTYHSLFTRFLTALPTLLYSQPSTNFNYQPFAATNAMLYDSTIVTQRLAALRPLLPAPPSPPPTHQLRDQGRDQGQNQKARDLVFPLLPVIQTILADPSNLDATAERAWTDIHRLQAHKAAAHREFRTAVPVSSFPSSSDEDKGIDVLVLPSTTCHPTVAEMLADPLALNARLGTFTHFVNLLDLCAVAVPLRQVSWKSKNRRDMPFGVTLVAGPGREAELMALGERVMGLEL